MIATTDVAGTLATADATLWRSWMETVAAWKENRYGVEIRTAGDLTLLHVHDIPLPYYNRVIGLDGATLGELDRVIDFFVGRRSACRIDVNPFYSSPDLLTELNMRGFHPSEFQTNLYGEIDSVEIAPRSGVSVRRVRKRELRFFARLYERSYYGDDAPKRLGRFRMDSILARAADPRWRFYMTLVDGVPAGGGAMFVDGEVATLAGGATMFTLRGRGCQAALLAQRIEDARAAGCRLIVSRCVVGTTSQRNMERAGLRTAYTKSIWERHDFWGRIAGTYNTFEERKTSRSPEVVHIDVRS